MCEVWDWAERVALIKGREIPEQCPIKDCIGAVLVGRGSEVCGVFDQIPPEIAVIMLQGFEAVSKFEDRQLKTGELVLKRITQYLERTSVSRK